MSDFPQWRLSLEARTEVKLRRLKFHQAFRDICDSLKLPSSRSAHLQTPLPTPTCDSVPTMFATPVPSQDGSRELRCVIENDLMFTVEVPCHIEIRDLKQVIQQDRAKDLLKGVSPDTLELWKVSAIDESRCESSSPHFQPRDSNPILHNTVKKSLGDISRVADQLNPTDPLLSIFPSQPPDEYVHVIVKVGE